MYTTVEDIWSFCAQGASLTEKDSRAKRSLDELLNNVQIKLKYELLCVALW